MILPPHLSQTTPLPPQSLQSRLVLSMWPRLQLLRGHFLVNLPLHCLGLWVAIAGPFLLGARSGGRRAQVFLLEQTLKLHFSWHRSYSDRSLPGARCRRGTLLDRFWTHPVASQTPPECHCGFGVNSTWAPRVRSFRLELGYYNFK